MWGLGLIGGINRGILGLGCWVVISLGKVVQVTT